VDTTLTNTTCFAAKIYLLQLSEMVMRWVLVALSSIFYFSIFRLVYTYAISKTQLN